MPQFSHSFVPSGVRFWVLATGNLGDEGAAVTSVSGSVNRSRLDLASPQLRDTHSVPQAVPIDGGRGMKQRSSRSVAGMDSSAMAGDAINENEDNKEGDFSSSSSVGNGRWSWGYSVLRLEASNPGLWPFHCHTALHASSGMAMVFEVSHNGT